MPDITDVVDLIHPADGAIGVVLGDQIWVLFDREVDEETVENGGIFVVGPDTDTWSGPDQQTWIRPAGHPLESGESDTLQSPGYQGIVQGSFTFERYDLTALSGVNTLDVTGSGTLYRSRAIFTPDIVLKPDTEYTVYLVGDEDDSDTVETGVKPRTIFDPIHSGSGSTDVSFVGTFSGGLAADVINVHILTSGVKRTATFEWFLDSLPLDVRGPVLTDKKVFLKHGVFVEFGGGTFLPADEYTAIIKEQIPFENTMFWTFDTGSGSLVDPPISTSTSAIGNIVPVTTVASTFALSEVTPLDKATNKAVTTNQIVLEFTSDIDTATVTSETVKLTGKPVNDDTSLFGSRTIFADITVTGKKIIMDF